MSTDLFYERDSARNAAWSEEGAIAVEMEAAALYAQSVRRRASKSLACWSSRTRSTGLALVRASTTTPS